MQGIFAGRTQLRYPYGRYGYTRGGGKIWHGGMDLVGSDSTDILGSGAGTSACSWTPARPPTT